MISSIVRIDVVITNAGIGSIMMDDESTKARNEIMRRIKIYQVKERNLPNFVRKKREDMLSRVSQLVF